MNYKNFINPSLAYAIVGATQNHEKYGWVVFDNLRRKGLTVIPVNPKYDEIDGVKCYPDVMSLHDCPNVVVLVVPTDVGMHVLKQAGETGIKKVWCQPGAESAEIVEAAAKYGIDIIAGGSCIMVATNGVKKSEVNQVTES